MIPEEREHIERNRSVDEGGNYNAEQKVMSYLRDKFSVEALKNDGIKRAAAAICAQVAADFDMKRGNKPPKEGYMELAKKTIDRFIDNWDGKKQGEDDRGDRIGKGNFAF